jgi:hypothetical protein
VLWQLSGGVGDTRQRTCFVGCWTRFEEASLFVSILNLGSPLWGRFFCYITLHMQSQHIGTLASVINTIFWRHSMRTKQATSQQQFPRAWDYFLAAQDFFRHLTISKAFAPLWVLLVLLDLQSISRIKETEVEAARFLWWWRLSILFQYVLISIATSILCSGETWHLSHYNTTCPMPWPLGRYPGPP